MTLPEQHLVLLKRIRLMENKGKPTNVQNIIEELHWSEPLIHDHAMHMVRMGLLTPLSEASKDTNWTQGVIYSTTEPGREYLATL